MENFKAFTLSYPSIVSEIETEVYVSQGFQPHNEQHREYKKYVAVWDTGATGSVIDVRVAKDLGLKIIDVLRIFHVQGSSFCNLYHVNIALPNKVVFSNLRVTEGQLEDVDVLIGMDIINKADFALTCPENKTLFSFRIPSMEAIDFLKGKG